jgi:hypothetical protein
VTLDHTPIVDGETYDNGPAIRGHGLDDRLDNRQRLLAQQDTPEYNFTTLRCLIVIVEFLHARLELRTNLHEPDLSICTHQ